MEVSPHDATQYQGPINWGDYLPYGLYITTLSHFEMVDVIGSGPNDKVCPVYKYEIYEIFRRR